MELQLSLFKELLQPIAILRAEHEGEHLDGKEIAAAHPAPLAAIRGEAAAGDDAVQVMMIQQGLAPGVQHGGDAQPRAELVLSELEQRRGPRLKEQRVQGAAVLRDAHGEA